MCLCPVRHVHPHVRSHQAPCIAHCVTRPRRACPWRHTVRAWAQGGACLCTCPRAGRCGGPTATASCPCRPLPGRRRRATTPRTAPSHCAPAPEQRQTLVINFIFNLLLIFICFIYIYLLLSPNPPPGYLSTSSICLHPRSSPPHNTSIHTFSNAAARTGDCTAVTAARVSDHRAQLAQVQECLWHSHRRASQAQTTGSESGAWCRDSRRARLAGVQRRLRGQVPQAQRGVAAAAGQAPPVRAEPHREHRIRVACRSLRRSA